MTDNKIESVELDIALTEYEEKYRKRENLIHSLREAICTYLAEQDIHDSPISDAIREEVGDIPLTDKAIQESGNDDAIALWENFVTCATSGYFNGASLDSILLQAMQSNPIFTRPQLKALAYLEEYCRSKNKTVGV